MTTTIGAAWWKFKEDGTQYLSISVNKELLPLAIREGKLLTLWEIPESERKKEKSPHYRLVLSDPEQK